MDVSMDDENADESGVGRMNESVSGEPAGRSSCGANRVAPPLLAKKVPFERYQVLLRAQTPREHVARWRPP